MADINISVKRLQGVDMESNIESVLLHMIEITSLRTLENANAWYELANVWCERYGSIFGLTTVQMCGIVAALSPQISWEQNKAQALKLCGMLATGETVTD